MEIKPEEQVESEGKTEKIIIGRLSLSSLISLFNKKYKLHHLLLCKKKLLPNNYKLFKI